MPAMLRRRAGAVQDRCGTGDAAAASVRCGFVELDLRRLRYFLAVADRLSFRGAAEELHIAQPALSRQIAALENELGVVLLTRDRRGVALTDAGRQLAADARVLLASAQETLRRVQRADRGAHRLVVGYRSGIVPTPAIRAFTERWPDATVEIRTLDWDDQERLITAGAVDVGFLRAPVGGDGLRVTPLFREPMLVALPLGHPLAQRDTLTEAEIADERHLRLFDPVPERGVTTGARLRSFEEKLEHVAAGNGIILLPRTATQAFRRPDVVFRPVPDAPPGEVVLAVDASRRSPLVRSFAELAVATMSGARGDEPRAA
jgi:DNA-binding transcriptional LysR family regulator